MCSSDLILRPKARGSLAHFYSLVTRDTRDQDFAANRQLFLTEQGYRYSIIYDDEIDAWQPPASTPVQLAGQPQDCLLDKDGGL